MKILTSDAMREVDRRAIEEIGIPGMVLMENAATGVVDAIGELYPEAASAAIFCGPGNNGGDGLAMGRHLAVRGYAVDLFVVRGEAELGGDAGTQLAICRRQGLALVELGPDHDLEPAIEAAAGRDLVIDALFGTGLTRSLGGRFATLVEALSSCPGHRIAVDLPSGLDASRAVPPGPRFQADLTVTFAAPKVAHCLPPASDAVGQLAVADLGIPDWLLAEAHSDLELLEAADVQTILGPRKAESHKGTYGHLLVVAGAPGRTGAAVLAARGAVRGGAGLVTAAVPAAVLDLVDGGSVESMTLPLACQPQGELSEAAVPALLAAAGGKSAAALGPGLGQTEEAATCIRRAVRELPLPLVLDADGVNAFAGRAPELAEREAATVLTPHPGELGRLLGIPTSAVMADRVEVVREAAVTVDGVVVLKGHRSLVATPTGQVWVNPTGNPGMATGGSGDVLTGLTGALLARGLDPLPATLLGVYVHGLAGDLAASTTGPEALSAGDIVDALPRAWEILSAA